ncbi:MAG TPA: PSD1 and planctomycete cytochrome C domain-containing protein [Candidatus Acidoferrales bacterium]|nr:PSD1 and planctomycete cytochrome C domain-containing protein [Candidatus Acidoferrales bacterium]
MAIDHHGRFCLRTLVAAAVLVTPSVLLAQPPAPIEPTAIQQILKTNCQPCHNDTTRSSGLALTGRDAILAGGNRGAAIKPGNPAESLLVRAIEQSGDLKMPPGRRLQPDQIASLRRWIELGAVWPTDKAGPAGEVTASGPKGSDWWAFQPVQRVNPPSVGDAAWVRNPIDQFILARLEKVHLRPSSEASRETLLRRVSLDLTGLVPSPEEIHDFLADTSPGAYERVVDRLLASPHYGERWGRHWLDVARYADSDGYTIDAPRQMWKYRDWVIHALNRDMPFDQFAIEQIAGDMMPNPTVDQLIATGFHRNTPSNYEGGIDFEQYRVEAVVDRVSTNGAAFLGLTLGCARCHDHKFDPVSQKEFYQLFAYFNNVDEVASEVERYDFNRPILTVPAPEELARKKAFDAQWASLSKELITYVRELAARARKPGGADHLNDPVNDPAKDPGLIERVQNLRDLRRREPKLTTTLVMRELPQPRETYVQLGGDFTRRGVPVQPAIPAVLPQLPAGANTRLDFAKWLVDPRNPLTARVTVNRIWQAYFGKGIVETENDFGKQGASPSHPELLDWLAGELVRQKWSQKAIHRLVVTSAAYRQSSKRRPETEAVDPDNKLLARQNRLRLEAEIIRDSALAASGLLTGTVGGPSVYPPIPEGAMSVTQVSGAWPTATGQDRYRRGLYTFFRRSAAYPGLAVFDAPDATSACTRRTRSNTPLQALTTLNDETFLEFAEGLAARVLKEAPPENKERIRYAYMLVLGRAPRPDEEERLQRVLTHRVDEYKTKPSRATELIYKGGKFGPDGTPANPPPPKLAAMLPSDLLLEAAWTGVARVLLNLDDFLTRE